MVKSALGIQAISSYNEAIRCNPRDPEAFYNRGITYARLGDFRKALSEFSEAIDLNPNMGVAYYNRGVCSSKLGVRAQAETDAQQSQGPGGLSSNEHRLSRHWHYLNDAKCKIWHGNLYGASIALSSFYDEIDINVNDCGSGFRPVVDQTGSRAVGRIVVVPDRKPDTTDRLRQGIPRRPSHIDGRAWSRLWTNWWTVGWRRSSICAGPDAARRC